MYTHATQIFFWPKTKTMTEDDILWNVHTRFLFVLVVLYWGCRGRGQFFLRQEHPLVLPCKQSEHETSEGDDHLILERAGAGTFYIEDLEGEDSSFLVKNILLSFLVNNQNMKHHKGTTIWSWGGWVSIFCVEDVEVDDSSSLVRTILFSFPVDNQNMKIIKGRPFDPREGNWHILYWRCRGWG